MNNLQALFDGLSQQWQRERAESQMTLGDLIHELRQLPPLLEIEGLGELQSYRGYYSDLAFSPTERVYEPDPERPGMRRFVEERVPRVKAHALLSICEAAMGQVFEGYKGGEFVMGAKAPLWVSAWGEASGQCLVRLAVDADTGICSPVTKHEDA